jgi:hypothetical protein
MPRRRRGFPASHHALHRREKDTSWGLGPCVPVAAKKSSRDCVWDKRIGPSVNSSTSARIVPTVNKNRTQSCVTDDKERYCLPSIEPPDRVSWTKVTRALFGRRRPKMHDHEDTIGMGKRAASVGLVVRNRMPKSKHAHRPRPEKDGGGHPDHWIFVVAVCMFCMCVSSQTSKTAVSTLDDCLVGYVAWRRSDFGANLPIHHSVRAAYRCFFLSFKVVVLRFSHPRCDGRRLPAPSSKNSFLPVSFRCRRRVRGSRNQCSVHRCRLSS